MILPYRVKKSLLVMTAHPAYITETFYSRVVFPQADGGTQHFKTYQPAVPPNVYQPYQYLEITLTYQ